jgi:integrase
MRSQSRTRVTVDILTIGFRKAVTVDDEVKALLGIPEPWAFYLRLALGTGLRWSEAT